MSDDRFLDRLRHDGRALRFEAGDVAVSRVAAHIRGRIRERSSPESLLMRWFRPLAASMMAVAVAATLGIAWIGNVSPGDDAVEMTAAAPDVALAGEILDVGE